MNPKDGGLSSSDRQRQTVTELARNKVLAAYSNSGSLSAAQNQNNTTINQNTTTQNNATIQPSGRHYLSETQQPQNSSLNRLKQNRSFAALSFLHSNQHRIEHRMLGEQTLRSELIQKYNSENRSSLKQAPINMNQKVDWQNYHSAWQNYYQKYYSEYYAKAAQKYLETEKSKLSAQTASTNAYLSQDSIARTEASAKQVEVSLRKG